MPYKLISLLPLQIARLLQLVRSIEPVALGDGREWGLLVKGHGFTRLLQDEPLLAPGLIRPACDYRPHPLTLHSKASAIRAAEGLGLLPPGTSEPVVLPKYWTWHGPVDGRPGTGSSRSPPEMAYSRGSGAEIE